MEFDADKWAAESAAKIADAVKANPSTFHISDDGTEDEAVNALRQDADDRGIPVPDDEIARQLIRNVRGDGDGQTA